MALNKESGLPAISEKEMLAGISGMERTLGASDDDFYAFVDAQYWDKAVDRAAFDKVFKNLIDRGTLEAVPGKRGKFRFCK